MTVIDRILALKDERNLTNRDVEIGAGLANSSISQWKKGKGKPSLDNIVKLSKFFHVSSDYLLCLTDDCASEDEISLTSDEISPKDISDAALSENGETPSVSPEERVILEIFRSLPAIDRLRLIQYCMNLNDMVSESGSPSDDCPPDDNSHI